ncbi:MAG: hypothetical protein V4582_10480 [Pseudomonadota bacterium]
MNRPAALPSQPFPPADTLATRGAGIAIIVSAIVSIVAVAMDATPTGKDARSVMQSMIALQQSHQLVHVIAMLCLGGLMFGHTVLSQRLGLRRAPVTAALTAYGLGTVLMFMATILDGFISTDIAASFVGKSPEAVQAGYWMIQAIGGIALVDIAKVSWVLQSVAVLCWSVALLRQAGLQRAVGVIGLAAGALPAITVCVVGSNMTDNVVVGILLLQAVWNLAAATVLLRDRSASPSVQSKLPARALAQAA